jgi:asparagine synthetase B (glutamine-hydrolysing)
MTQVLSILNASDWHVIRWGERYVYSPHLRFLNTILNQTTLLAYYRQTYTAFACVIYDPIVGDIRIARDHFGQEPCYYSYTHGQFIFGSTIPDILKQMRSPPAINLKQMNQLFITKWFDIQTYSDETYYETIYRAEPGHETHMPLSSHNSVSKIAFWDLKRCNQIIHYHDTREYVEHFSALLSEALRPFDNTDNLAAEFSGGLDSSAIVTAAYQRQINLDLYMHVATQNNQTNNEQWYAQRLISALTLKTPHYVDATAFDLLGSMQEYARYFAGAAPYTGFVLASNLHQAIVQKGHHTVLSGVGGDECVSSHAPIRCYIPHLLQEQTIGRAWREFYQAHQINGSLSHHPLKLAVSFMTLACSKKNLSLREHEYSLLQGLNSHHLRMRVEYNAVLAKALGFCYAYPLLYPPLIEFCYQLPPTQKRQQGLGRYLMRQYLAQFYSDEVYQNRSKSGSVTPATLEKSQTEYDLGKYKTAFQHLPFESERQYTKNHHNAYKTSYSFMQDIPAYMFKIYWDETYREYSKSQILRVN